MKKINHHLCFLKTGKLSLNIFTILFISFLFIPRVKAQAPQPGVPESPEKIHFRQLFTQGNLMMSENFIDSALQTFLVLYPLDTSDANVCYFIGQLYMLTEAHKAQALPYLRTAARRVNDKYLPDDPYEKQAPPNAYYYLARAQHLNYQFDTAIDNFIKFKNLLELTDTRRKDIDYWITCCNNAKGFVESPTDCKVVNLGDSINSRYPDYSPVITADEQEIMFTSRRPNALDSTKDINGRYYEDIWMSYAKPNMQGWTTAENLGSPLNTPGNEATISLSPDGQELILYREGEQGNGNIYASKLRGYQWSYTQFIDSANTGIVNGSSWNPSACLSPDRKTLFFSSNRPGGLGGTDLYEVHIGDDGKWGDPVNMGHTINTEYDEDAPFMHPDDSTFFFSSKGHNTMGGFDVFMARENPDGQWGHLKNMGYPINTPDDDIYFKVSADGRRAYYTSTRPGGYGERDNYEVFFKDPLPVQPVAVLVGYIITPDNGGRLPNDITVVSSGVNGSYSTTASVNPRTGKFLQVLRPNQNYNISINTQGHKVFNQKFFLPSDSSYHNLSRAFFRTKIILGDTTNVFVPKGTMLASSNTGKVAGVKMTGRMLLNNDPVEPLSNMPMLLLDDKGHVLKTGLTNSDGFFSFDSLTPDNNYIVKADLKDSKLKHLKQLYLLNSNGTIVRNYDENEKKAYLYHNLPTDLTSLPELAIAHPVAVAETANNTADETPTVSSANNPDFTRYFGYNTADVSANDAGFSALIDKIASKAAAGSVHISIQGSASKVPTTLFSSSNKSLASSRSKTTKDVILDALKAKQVDISKVNVQLESAVKGPNYEHDAKDESKYQKFQYVKVYVR